MSDSISEHRAIHLHAMFIKALSASTVKKPVTLDALRKLAEPVFGGAKVLDRLLEQLSAAKAISSSSGMRDGERYVAYWVTGDLGDFMNRNNFVSARQFTAAEKGLIRKVNGFMPAQQLLDILNERLVCDLGPAAVPYSMGQLYAEIGDVAAGAPAGGHDWPSLRKLIAKSERSGVLDAIDERVINDFAVVFSLNQKQVLVMKDIVLQAKEVV